MAHGSGRGTLDSKDLTPVDSAFSQLFSFSFRTGRIKRGINHFVKEADANHFLVPTKEKHNYNGWTHVRVLAAMLVANGHIKWSLKNILFKKQLYRK